MKQAKWFLLLHVILGIYAGSSVCSKLAAQQPFLSAAFIVLYGLMLLALVTYAVGWQQVIKHLPLTTAYANKAVTVVWGILLGLAVFGEAVTPRQVIGAVIIICGIVLFVRADNEGEVGKLLAKIDEGYDVVYASYDTKRQAGWRNLGSWVNSKMTEIMLGKPPELVVNSYFAARRFIVDEMLRYEHCYPYVIGLVLRSTKRICNVPVHHRAREEGRSGYTLSKLLNLWMNGFTSFSVKPLRIATYIGTLFAVAGFLYFIYIIIDHFTRAAAPIGWASTTALLLLLGGMILVVLGIMGEYVGRIYMCANAAPQYVEREVIRHEENDA